MTPFKRGDIVEYVGDTTPKAKGSIAIVLGPYPDADDDDEAVLVDWIFSACEWPSVPPEGPWLYTKNLRKISEVG